MELTEHELMDQKNQPGVKRTLLQYGKPVLASIVGSAMYHNFITPAIPYLPKLPFILYSVFMTAFTFLFLIGIVAVIWGLLTTGWKHLTSADVRNDLRGNIRTWPTSKWDLLPAIATTYFLATMLPMMTVLLVIPQGRLVGVVSQEEFATIFLVVFTPMMLIFGALVLRWGFAEYRETKRRWVTGTRRERIVIASAAAFVLAAWGFMVIGELTGWDDLLWINNT